MAGATITGSTANQYIDAKIVWSSTPNTSANTSTVTATLYYRRNNSNYTTYGSGTFSITINGRGNTSGRTLTIGDEWVAAVSSTVTVTHDDDGKKSITISASGSIPGTTLSSTSVSGTAKLDTIARPTTVDSVSSGGRYFDEAKPYTYTPKSATLYNRLVIKLEVGDEGSWPTIRTEKLGQKAASQQTGTFTLTAAQLKMIYEYLPSTDKSALWYYIYTYSDSSYTKLVGETKRGQVYVIREDDTTRPTMTMTLSPVSNSSSLGSLYVKGQSKVKATFTNGAGKYGASIVSYKMTVAGKEYESPFTSDYLSTAGGITVTGTITDSRGFSRSYSQVITVVDYTIPSSGSLTCDTSYFTGTITYKYTPPSADFYIRCVIELDLPGTGAENEIKIIDLGKKPASQQTETIKLLEDDLSNIYNKLPSSASGTLRCCIAASTKSDYSTIYSSTNFATITLSIPNDDTTKPTATLSVAPITSLASPFNSLYIKGKAKVRANLTGGAGKYGASIVSYSVKVGADGGTPPYTSEYLTTAGALTITGTVTDTRGFSKTYSKAITVIDYSSPQVLPKTEESSVIVARCDSNGVLSDTGTTLLIKAKRGYSKVVSANVQKNFCELQYRYRGSGGSWSSWTTFLARTSTADEITYRALDGALPTTLSYFVQIRAIDDIGEATSTSFTIPSESVYMHKAGSINSFGLGTYVTDANTFAVGEDITSDFRGKVRFSGEEWVELPLGTNVINSTVNSGRWGGTGVFYRVCAGEKHIYIAFNVSFTTSSSTVRAESQTIPYPPTYDVYALCPVGFSDGSRGIATVSVSPKGRVNIYAVHKLPGATLSTGDTVSWIDGYIDYWT